MESFDRLVKILPIETKKNLSTELAKLINNHNFECFVCCKKLSNMNTIVSYKLFNNCECGSSINFACLRCADAYLQIGKPQKCDLVKHPICSQRINLNNLMKNDAYTIETELMEELDKITSSTPVVHELTCDCGLKFTNRIKLYKHMEKDCLENYKSCPAPICNFYGKIKDFTLHLIQHH
jgi:hypothetical protein